jgi:hypothetical protein
LSAIAEQVGWIGFPSSIMASIGRGD